MDKKIEMLHKLCEALMEELDEYAKKIEKAGGMNAGDLEAVDKLTHALKSAETTISMMKARNGEDGYSGRYMPYWAGMSYAEGGGGQGGNRGGSSNRGGNSYEGGSSYARGGRGGRNNNPTGRNQYSREGGYSYAGDFETALEEAMDAAPNDQMREKLRRMMEEM